MVDRRATLAILSLVPRNPVIERTSSGDLPLIAVVCWRYFSCRDMGRDTSRLRIGSCNEDGYVLPIGTGLLYYGCYVKVPPILAKRRHYC